MSAAKEKTTLRPALDELVLDVKRRRDHRERARPSGREHPHPKVQKQQKKGEIEKSSEFVSEKRYKIRDHPGGRLGREWLAVDTILINTRYTCFFAKYTSFCD